ncbi:hypothetical protein EHS13_12015 [Paenibacillus psychroresistens]|uniref:Uncharacterized protein n=1 Tax=Paenibacillus psychroresistens TaxID=1778678 RepID=A0A6B8RIJ2_9BACL|nr:hypothetical protein [Paenibacillus psychroresistens]QGQ95554.1 hypothetical protein EHS13_12015 [Paenibacillus psychroresistens]
MSRRNFKEEEQLHTINQELNDDQLSDEELQQLAQRLPRYTAIEPSVHQTRMLIERMRPHMQHDSKLPTLISPPPMIRFSEILEQREASRLNGWARIKQYLLPQAQLLAWSFWLVSALVVVLGTFLYILFGGDLAQVFSTYQWHTHPLILLIPLLTGFSLSYSFRSYGTPMYELELSFPITPAQWLLSKLSIIVLYDIMLGTAASLIIYSLTPTTGIASFSLLPFIVSWLVPLCLYCVGSVACMLRFGTLIGSLVMAAAWFIQLFMMNKLGPFYFLSDPSYGQWQESKWIGLLITLLFASDVIVYLRKMKGSSAMLIK